MYEAYRPTEHQGRGSKHDYKRGSSAPSYYVFNVINLNAIILLSVGRREHYGFVKSYFLLYVTINSSLLSIESNKTNIHLLYYRVVCA